MADYYTYTAYTSCFGQIDQDNPPEMFTKFQEEMQKLPLQQSSEGYQQAFLQVASQNNVQVDAQMLENLKFTPEFSLELPQAQMAEAIEQ